MSQPFPTSRCRSCGELVIWAVLPSGKRCPITADTKTFETFNAERVPIYSLAQVGAEIKASKIDKSQTSMFAEFYVSHFATCVHAGVHTKK